MSAITSKLDNALADVEDLIPEIESNIDRLDSPNLSDRNAIDLEIESALQQFEDLLNQMTKDVANVKQAESKQYFEGEITEKRKIFSKLNEKLKQKRMAATNNPVARQKQQLESNANKSQNIVDTLDKTIQTANTTIDVGNAINAQLIDDRELLQRTDQRLDEIHNQGAQGERTAKNMLKRACLNGVISWTICFLLLIALIGSIIYKCMK